MSQTMEKKVDVLVIGATLEGCVTALELAKGGYRVLLTEESGSLGGMATNGLEVYLPWRELSESKVREYASYIWQEAGKEEGLLGPLYHDQKCKLVLKRMLEEAGVTFLTHVFPAKISQKERELVCDMAVKTGYLRILAKAVIDATDFGEMAGIAGWNWQQDRDYVSVSVKWNGVKGEQLKTHLQEGYEDKGGCVTGRLRLMYHEEREGIQYGGQEVVCCHNDKFGETIMIGLTAKVPGIDPFTLSRAQSGLRKFAYGLRDHLRSQMPGFEKANIIHVSPILNQYGVRKFETDREKGLFLINGSGCGYAGLQAIEKGIDMSEQVKNYLIPQ